MSTLPSDTSEDDGAPVRLDKRATLASAAVAAVLVAIASWFGWHAAHEAVRWSAVGFAISSPTEVEATYDVYLYTAADAVCHVHALNARFAEVGVTTQVVKRAQGDLQRVTTTFTTTERAVTAVVDYCEAA